MDCGTDLSFDFTEGLDFPAPAGDSRYPPELQHPVLVWSDEEEDLQGAALSWLLQWRKTNPFILCEGDRSHFRDKPQHKMLWKAHGEKMADWAWLEKGGLDLEAMEDLLIKRHTIRVAARPPFATDPAGAGSTKEK